MPIHRFDLNNSNLDLLHKRVTMLSIATAINTLLILLVAFL